MIRPFAFALVLAGFSSSTAFAQANVALLNTYVAAPADEGDSLQQEPAAIERAPVRNRPGYSSAPSVTSTQLIAGVWLRSERGASVQTVSADKHGAEVKVESGRVNVAVRHPAQDSQILVDLPGGQTALLKDGVYTFNAESDTVHVLEGEAVAYPGNREDDGIKLKDAHMFAFGSGDAHAKEFASTATDTDLLPGSYAAGNDGYGRREYNGGEYLYAGGPYYGYAPYYGFGYPYYGYGYGPWGYGYPFGIGIGFGYYGGFGGYYGGFGGFRGGVGHGFRR